MVVGFSVKESPAKIMRKKMSPVTYPRPQTGYLHSSAAQLSGGDAQHDFAALMRRTSKHLVGYASVCQREHSPYVRN